MNDMGKKLTNGSILVMTTLMKHGFNASEGLAVLAVTVATMIVTKNSKKEDFDRYVEMAVKRLQDPEVQRIIDEEMGGKHE